MAKTSNNIGPTKYSISILLRELNPRYRNNASEHPEVVALVDKIDAIEKHYEEMRDANSELKKLRKEYDRVYAKAKAESEVFYARINKVRRRFLAYGLTPAVVKEIQELTELTHPT